VGFRFAPRDDAFYDLFGRSAAYLVAGADELTAILGAEDDGERKAIAKRVTELENAADDITHTLVAKVRASFLTPFDRGDMVRLAAALDDCLDHMECAADLIRLHRISEIHPRMGRQVDGIARMAALTLDAMPRLRTFAELADYWIEINRLENQADKNHRRLVADLFDTHGTDPVGLARQLLVVDALEAVADAFETVAQTIEGIAVKET
jgi:predicted phosphate transport protein (TIGR00153 family)